MQFCLADRNDCCQSQRKGPVCIIIMKNFNRCSSHGHHGSKLRDLVQYAHSHGSHAFTHTFTSTQLQPCGAKRQLSYYYAVHAGSFRVSVSHQTLTWTTGSLSCARDHSGACVYTHGLGTPIASQHNIFDSEKLTNFSYAPDGIQTTVLWILSPTHYQLSHPITPCMCDLVSSPKLTTLIMFVFAGKAEEMPLLNVANKPTPTPATQTKTKDDAYDQFMMEMAGLI